MSEITVKIKGIKKDVAKNGKPFYRVTLDDGTVAFAWDWKHIKNAKIGKMATLTTEKQGNYLYITDSALAEEEPVEEIESEDSDVIDDVKEVEEDERSKELKNEDIPGVIQKGMKCVYVPKKILPASTTDLAISRMSALKAAIEYLNYCAVFSTKGDPLTETEVCEISRRFEEYIYNGK